MFSINGWRCQRMKYQILTAALVMLLVPGLTLAATVKSGKIEDSTQKQIEEKRQSISAEAITALSETRNALLALDRGKKADAMAALERATGKLDVLLARQPHLELATAEVRATIIDLNADAKTIRDVRSLASMELN